MWDDAVLLQGRHTKRKYKRLAVPLAALALCAAVLAAYPGILASARRAVESGLRTGADQWHDLPEGADVCAMTERAVVAAGQGGVYLLGFDGRLLDAQEARLSSPLIRTTGPFAAVYDSGGTQLFLAGKAAITAVEISTGIDAAAVSADGSVAVLTAGSGYCSEVRIYRKDGALQSRTGFLDRAVGKIAWLSGGELALCTLSPAGQWALEVDGAAIPLSASMVYDLKPCGGDAAIWTDEGVSFYREDGELIAQYPGEFSSWACGEIAALTARDGDGTHLTLLSPDGSVSEVLLHCVPRTVAVSGDQVCVLDAQAFWVYDRQGRLLERDAAFASCDAMECGPLFTNDGQFLLHKTS